MAATFTPTNALNFAKRMIGDAPLDDTNLQLRVLNAAANLIHMAAPWRWSVGELDSNSIANGTIDYDFVDPTDVFYLLGGELNHADGKKDTLQAVSYLPNNTVIAGTPQQVMLVDADTYRVYPSPSGFAATFPVIRVFYKKKNTVITAGNVGTATTLLFPDEWFFVFEQACLMFAYQFINDPRGGSAQFAGGQSAFSGQWGVTMSLLQYMIEKEKPFFIDGIPSQG